MSARILMIDPVATNRILLKVRLTKAFYSVLEAGDLDTARRHIRATPPDLILVDAASAPDTLREMKRAGQPHTPVVVLAPHDNREGRIDALKAGASDVISKPLREDCLLARIRNLLRNRTMAEELRVRSETCDALGFAEPTPDFDGPANIAIVTPVAAQGRAWRARLRRQMAGKITLFSGADALRQQNTDVFVMPADHAGLALLTELRSRVDTRRAAILMVTNPRQAENGRKALDLGASDVLPIGFDPEEASLRLRAILRRKREDDRMRKTLEAGLEAAIRDPLTGLYNRRYATSYLERMAQTARASGRQFAVMLLDLDHFKRVNDTFGHGVGDLILKGFAERVQQHMRSADLVARLGGEEFIVALPDTTPAQARQAAERICILTTRAPFVVPGTDIQVPISCSVGLTFSGDKADDTLCGTAAPAPGQFATTPDLSAQIAQILQDADQALYQAKERGRNTVSEARSAA